MKGGGTLNQFCKIRGGDIYFQNTFLNSVAAHKGLEDLYLSCKILLQFIDFYFYPKGFIRGGGGFWKYLFPYVEEKTEGEGCGLYNFKFPLEDKLDNL